MIAQDRKALISDLQRRALQLRRHIVEMTGAAGSGHPGGSLSAADFIAALYFHQMRHDPTNPHWADRDRFVLSKGHACPVLYAALAECGYFPVEELCRLRKLDSILQGHPDMTMTPGLEMSTGSLGNGFSAAVGMALAGKMDRKDYRIYVMIGDGECDEGQIWEAAMFAAHHQLDNLIGILDKNGFQNDYDVKGTLDTAPLADKWRAFRWRVTEIDGHDMGQIVEALEWANVSDNAARDSRGQPTMIVGDTVKGKGVSFMENNNEFHGKAPTPEQVELALQELSPIA